MTQSWIQILVALLFWGASFRFFYFNNKKLVYYTYSRTQLYFTYQYSGYTITSGANTWFGPTCWPSSGCNLTYRAAIQDVWGEDKINQPDVTFRILYFSSNSYSTCFGQPCAHHQQLTTVWCVGCFGIMGEGRDLVCFNSDTIYNISSA